MNTKGNVMCETKNVGALQAYRPLRLYMIRGVKLTRTRGVRGDGTSNKKYEGFRCTACTKTIKFSTTLNEF
jgi:hypothetical protein